MTKQRLSPFHQRIMSIEAAHPVHSAAKVAAITGELGMSAVRYYQVLGQLVLTEAAQEADPMVVRRVLRRVTATGANARIA